MAHTDEFKFSRFINEDTVGGDMPGVAMQEPAGSLKQPLCLVYQFLHVVQVDELLSGKDVPEMYVQSLAASTSPIVF